MKKPLCILIVEHNEEDVFFILRELEMGGFQPIYQRVDALGDFTTALDTKTYDLILCDHSFAGFTGLDVLHRFRQREMCIPFIIVSGAPGEETAVEAMKAGADDYVMKPHLGRLVPAVVRALRVAENHRARLRVEEALQRSEKDLKDFFNHSCMAMHWVGPDGTLLRVNQAELDMLGYTREEYEGHSILEFFLNPDHAENFLKRLHIGEEVQNYETRLVCKNGGIKDVAINSNVLWQDGRFVHSRSFMRDISDRKAAEKARAYLASIVEGSDDAIIGVTLDGTILSWNPGATRMYGYEAGEVIGLSISILSPPYRPEEWSDLFGRMTQGERIHNLEAVRRRKDGSTVEVELTLSPILDDLGELVGISALESDITPRKQEEAERLELIRELTDTLAKIRIAQGMLPVCPMCRKIRDEDGAWKPIETYISEHTYADVTHGVCPQCIGSLTEL